MILVTQRIALVATLLAALGAASAACSSGDSGGMGDAGGSSSSSSGGGSSSSGSGSSSGGGSSSSSSSGGPSFATTVYPIFTASCAPSCHMAGGLASNFDLSGTAPATYTALINKAAPSASPAGAMCGTSTKKLVVPSMSAQSLLYDKVATATPSCGASMPLGSLLPAAQIATIKTWIDQGANP